MLFFLVLNLDDDLDENFVELYDEDEFMEASDSNPMEYKDITDDQKRIETLVSDCGYSIVWSRKEAVEEIMQQITFLPLDDHEEWQLLKNYSDLLNKVASRSEWDLLLEEV